MWIAVFQESDAQEDDIYDDPQEAEVIQSLLDVVDEEAQNLLTQTSAAGNACAPGSGAREAAGPGDGQAAGLRVNPSRLLYFSPRRTASQWEAIWRESRRHRLWWIAFTWGFYGGEGRTSLGQHCGKLHRVEFSVSFL